MQSNPLPERLRICELFAGIGGWRVALEAMLPAGIKTEFAPFDSGPHCSEVYALNFKEPCCRRNIEQLDVQALDGFDIWAMSPPCQPFSTTRAAKQRGLEDRRCKALEHLCNILPRLANPPRWIVLENVKGFFGSDASEKWQAALKETGFTSKQLLLDPAHFGIPNHRTRYYLVAERSPRFRCLGEVDAHSSSKHHVGDGDRNDIANTAAIDTEGAATDGDECATNIAEEGIDVASAAPEVLPPGILVEGSWARIRRAEIDDAHASARTAGSREAKEDIFNRLRREFVAHLHVFCEENELVEGEGPMPKACRISESADSASKTSCKAVRILGDSNWKLLSLPRSVTDAFLLVFDDAGSAVGHAAAHAFLSEVSHRRPSNATWSWTENVVTEPRRIADFLEEASLSPAERSELIVPEGVLAKPFARGLSYVEPETTMSFCFTGHYGKVLHKSSGSLLYLPEHTRCDTSGSTDAPQSSHQSIDRDNLTSAYGRVRFFSPKEILNMFGFPVSFSLPGDLELRHRYKVVGNSIAVCVAEELLRFLLLGVGGPRLQLLSQPVPVSQLHPAPCSTQC